MECLDFRVLKAILCEKETQDKNSGDFVSCENLGKIISWFGPWEASMLEKIRMTLQQPWFHGFIDKGEAEAALTNTAKGSFLVRFSNTLPGSYTISKMSKQGKINHQRIDYSPNKGFSIQFIGSNGNQNIEVQSRLDVLIATMGKQLYLKHSIATTKWKHLFELSGPSDGYLLPKDDIN